MRARIGAWVVVAGAPMLLATSILLAACAAPAPALPPPASGGSAAGAANPYVLPLDPDWLDDGVTVSVRVAGGPATRMLVDTGSNGVVIARTALGTDYRLPSPRQRFTGFTYSSSGRSYSGEWVLAVLAMSSVQAARTGTATTVPMLVRAVDRSCDAAGRCTTDPAEIGVAMLGVGFDREQDDDLPVDAHAGPALNPFLNLTEMVAGTMRRSYLIGSGSLSLGVATPVGFSTVALEPTTTATGTADWAAPQACLEVTGSVAAQCGSVLVDTGLGDAIVQVPTGVNPPERPRSTSTGRPVVANGQRVTVTLPALADRRLYAFTVGTKDAPTTVEWGHDIAVHGGQNFFNVSRYALSQFDYLYDATGGRLGFRWTS